jgi:hypothetical protein
MNIDMELHTIGERDWAKMRVRLGFMILALMTSSFGWAQSNNPVVETHAVMATEAVHANSPVKLAVLAQVATGYHINDHKPTLDYLIPTKFEIVPGDQFTVKNVVYPKGTLKKFPFSDVPLSVYEGKVVVGMLLRAGTTVPAGTYTLKAKFAYQACNDHACLAPTSVPLILTIKVVPHNVPLKAVEPDVFERIKFE